MQPRRRAPSLGRRGERAAAAYLRTQGYRVTGRNIRLAMGEIDLLAETPDRRTLVVVEVKSRIASDGDPARLPERAITAAKRRKLVSLARAIKRMRGNEGRPLRIDVVAVEFNAGAGGASEIRHYPNAIDAAGGLV